MLRINQVVRVTGEQLHGAIGSVEGLADDKAQVRICGVVNGEEVQGVFLYLVTELEAI